MRAGAIKASSVGLLSYIYGQQLKKLCLYEKKKKPVKTLDHCVSGEFPGWNVEGSGPEDIDVLNLGISQSYYASVLWTLICSFSM